MNLNPVIIKFRPAWKRLGYRFGRRPAPIYVPRPVTTAEYFGLDDTMPLDLPLPELARQIRDAGLPPKDASGDFPWAGSLTSSHLTGSGGDD